MNNEEFICKICGTRLSYDSNLVLKHLSEHLLDYSRYYEYCKLESNKAECPECRKKLYRITPWSNYILPCYDCNDQKLYYKKIFEIIHGWQDYIITGKYVSLWLSNKDYRDRYLNFSFQELDKLIEKIRVRDKFKIDKINLFDIHIDSGISKEISSRNIDNIHLERSKYHFEKNDFKFINSINGYEFNIGKNKYSLILPEECEYNNKTYYRHSIFNMDSSRLIRRLKISSGTCIKFYNTISPYCKSIFLLRKNNEEINTLLLSDDILEHIKFYILRNSELLKYIFQIYNEMIKYPVCIFDNVFLINKLFLNREGKGDLTFNWSIFDMKNISSNSINITIV